MSEEAVEIDIDLHELAIEWAACRRAIITIRDLSPDELDRFAYVAARALFDLEDVA